MAVKKVAVIMGSDSDFPTVSAAIKRLKALEIPERPMRRRNLHRMRCRTALV